MIFLGGGKSHKKCSGEKKKPSYVNPVIMPKNMSKFFLPGYLLKREDMKKNYMSLLVDAFLKGV